MTKAELVAAIAKKADLSKAAAEKVLNSFMDVVKAEMKKKKDKAKVALVGFGTFEVVKRKARIGRNPKTGKAIKIAASLAPKFKAGKGLKKAVA